MAARCEPTHTTALGDVGEVLRLLVDGLEAIFAAQLVGLYLTGSLSYGGFHRGSSDIDLLALLQRAVTTEQRTWLIALHERIAAQHPRWATRLEISYLPIELLGSIEPPAQPRAYFNGGRLWDPDPHYGQEWTLNLFVLRRRGIALRGPAPANVFPDVSMAAMRAAALRSLREEWEPLLDEPAPLDDPHQQAYVILTLCRILHTARHDGIASKRDAAAWVRHAHPQWADLVRNAEAWEYGRTLGTADEILAFLRFVTAETQRGAEPTS